MILLENELVELFPDENANELVRRMAAIEAAIRSYTNNNFQHREIRIIADIVDGKIKGTSPYLRANDTIMISKGVSKGLYTIKSIDIVEGIEVNEPIFDSSANVITKVLYPADVIEGCIKLLNWDISEAAEKARDGVQSETLSRHSVSYGNLADSTLSGYPSYLLSFLSPYRKPTV